jgi:hypothetical protein
VIATLSSAEVSMLSKNPKKPAGKSKYKKTLKFVFSPVEGRNK